MDSINDLSWFDTLVFYCFYLYHTLKYEVQNEISSLIPRCAHDIVYSSSAIVLVFLYTYLMYLTENGCFCTDDVEDYFDAFDRLFKLEEDDLSQDDDDISDDTEEYYSAEEDGYESATD